ncbi:MAG: glycosyltransferase [Acholeplasmataceae bacterium]
MKIGFFVDAYYPMMDGVVNVVNQYATILSHDHEVYVFAPKPGDKTYKDDFPYQVIRVLKIQVPNTDYHLALPTFDAKLNKLLSRIKLDIVHIHSPFSMGELGVSYAKKYHVPLFATLHSQYKKDFELRLKLKPLTEMMLNDIIRRLNKCDQTFTVNPSILDVYMNYGLNKAPEIIPNATEMTYQMGHQHVQSLMKTHHISPEVFNMLFVGRIDKIKNISFIIDTLEKLKDFMPKFHMYFVGKGPDEDYFKSLIKSKKLTSFCTFTGPIYDRGKLSAMYEIADLFVFPSLYDTNSLVQLEAASQKTPTIFIKGSATAHHITHDINGYLVDANPTLFAEKIYHISSNIDLNKTIGEKAFETIYHPWEDSVNKVLEYYKKALERTHE